MPVLHGSHAKLMLSGGNKPFKHEKYPRRREIDTRRREIDTRRREIDTRRRAIDPRRREIDTRRRTSCLLLPVTIMVLEHVHRDK